MASDIVLTVIGESGGAPLPGGGTSCYLVEAEGYRVLLDIGSASLSLLSGIIPFDSIDDVIISHFHSDHASDAGVAVYSRLISMQLGRNVKPLVFHALEDRSLSYPPYSRVELIKSGKEEQIGPFTVGYMHTDHPVPCLAVKLLFNGKSIVYTADGSLTDELIAFSSSADILLSECSFYPDFVQESAGHMSARDVVSLAAAAEPGKLIITHLPVYGDREEILKYIRNGWKGESILASKFLRVEI